MDKSIITRIVDNMVLPIAKKKHEEAVAKWEADIETEEERNEYLLHKPEFAASLGLPEHLPDHTIKILKHTMALDKVGPDMPNASEIYRRYGL